MALGLLRYPMMGRFYSLLLSVLVTTGMNGCTEPVAQPDAADLGQGSETSAALVINEVSPKPASGADWIEVMNNSADAIDLCGYFVTDSLDRLDHYYPLGGVAPPQTCPPRMLEAGAYLVVHADDDAGAPFKLGVADEAHVVTINGEPVDSFLYLYPAGFPGESLARTPNGTGRFYPMAPSPNEANAQEPL